LTSFELIRLVIIVGGAASLALSTFLSRPWLFASWVKADFWLLGLACLLWAVLKIILLLYGHSLSRQAYLLLDSQRPFLLGFAFAMLVLFFVSGEAHRGMQRRRELKKQRS
jgi:hypothetical protein